MGQRSQASTAAAATVQKFSRLWAWDLLCVVGILVLSLVALAGVLAFTLRDLTPVQLEQLRFPTKLEDAQAIGSVLKEYTATHFTRVLFAHACCYLFLQTFAIPGTVFVNLLGGALFGMSIGFPLCLLYNTVGSVLLYSLSALFGRRLVARFFSGRLEQLREALQSHRGSLTRYMTFMRIFPFTPNWFMNVSAPQLHVPVSSFAAAVAMGLTPYNFLSCRAGLLLMQLRSKSDIMDPVVTAQLAAIAVFGFFAPILWKKLKLGKRFGLE